MVGMGRMGRRGSDWLEGNGNYRVGSGTPSMGV